MKILTKTSTVYLLLMVLFLFSCNKERKPLSWNIDLVAPLIYGELSIKDLLKDSLLTSNPDNSIQLSFSTNIYNLNFDSLIKIPDTTLNSFYNIPYSAGVTFNPGQTFVSEPENISLKVDDVELTKVGIKGGKINYSLNSNIPAVIIYEYTISNAFDKQGNPFIKELTLPAATNGNSSISGSFDLSGFSINLTGVNANEYNTLSTFINIKLSDNHPTSLLLTNQDSVKIENQISDLTVQYAEGYFGNQHVSQNNSNDIKQMNNIIAGAVDIEQVAVSLTILNGIGADAAFTIQHLDSKSDNATIPLTHQIIGDENFINRATNNSGNISTTEFSSIFNSSNSNIEAWLENLPDSVLYGLDFELNPIGNVSGHHDFIDIDAPFEVNMNVDMPLSFLANNLTLIDTLSFNPENIEQIISGKLKINIDNGFPLQADLSLKNMVSSEELFSQKPINSALIDNNGKVNQSVESTHEITLSAESLNLLRTDNFLILKVKFNSPPSSNLISIYDYYKLKFNVVTDFTYQTKIE